MQHLPTARSYEEDFDTEWFRETCYSTIDTTEAYGGRVKLSAAVGLPTIRQFKQCRPIPVVMLKIMHLATVQTSPIGVEQNSNDFGQFQTVYTKIRCHVRDVASDLGIHCLKVLMVGNRTAALNSCWFFYIDSFKTDDIAASSNVFKVSNVTNYIHLIGNVQGEKLLDVGTGPTVHTVISASRHVTDIYLSDLVDRNRAVLQKWKGGEQIDIPSFRYVLGKENDGTTLEDRQSIVREQVTDIFSLDLRLSEPLRGSRSKYDIIIASLSLLVGANTIKEVEERVGKVVAMMKTNGHLLIVECLNCSFYRVGNVTFNIIPLSRDDTKQVLNKAGLKLECWKEMIEEGYTSSKSTTDYTDLDDDWSILHPDLFNVLKNNKRKHPPQNITNNLNYYLFEKINNA